MKSTIQKRSDSQVVLNIQLDQAALQAIVDRTYDGLRRNLKVAGFRPGKAPNSIVERELGSGTVQGEVLQAATSHSYAAAVREHDLPVIAQPEVKLTKFVPYTELEYEATAELLPPIKLADYKHLDIKTTAAKVEPAEIDQVIEDLRKRVAGRADADRPAASGDEVVIDFKGTRDGQPVAGATSQNYPLILGSQSFIPGFEDQLVGMKGGESKDFDIAFPKDYGSPELAGQTVRFAIKLHRVVAVTLPSVDDGLAAQLGPYKTLAELRASIEADLQQRHQQDSTQAYEQAMLDKLLQDSKLTVPTKLLEGQTQRLHQELEESLEKRSQTLADYTKERQQTEKDVDRELSAEAHKRLAMALILAEVAKAEGVSVGNQEVADELARLKSQYQDTQMQQELNQPEIREEIYNHLMTTKTIAKIKEYNKE